MIKELAYKGLNILTLGKGITRTFSSNKVRIPTRFFKYFTPDYEQENLSIINSKIKKGMYIIDVGAHIGLMSSIFGNKVGNTGKVFAFEPTPSTFNILKKTIGINNLSAIVKPVNAAL
jgi:tRNA G37 N-methylase Trm5